MSVTYRTCFFPIQCDCVQYMWPSVFFFSIFHWSKLKWENEKYCNIMWTWALKTFKWLFYDLMTLFQKQYIIHINRSQILFYQMWMNNCFQSNIRFHFFHPITKEVVNSFTFYWTKNCFVFKTMLRLKCNIRGF